MDYLQNATQNRNEGAFNIAAVALATLFHNDFNKSIDPRSFFSEEQMMSIFEVNQAGFERMNRILSTGNVWAEEEYLLIFTYRINFQLVYDYFSHYGLSFKIEGQVNDLDEMIKRSVSNKINEKTTKKAASRILKSQKNELKDLWMKNVFSAAGVSI